MLLLIAVLICNIFIALNTSVKAVTYEDEPELMDKRFLLALPSPKREHLLNHYNRYAQHISLANKPNINSNLESELNRIQNEPDNQYYDYDYEDYYKNKRFLLGLPLKHNYAKRFLLGLPLKNKRILLGLPRL